MALTIAAVLGLAMSCTNERSIFSLSNGKRAQIAQRRVAGAEVVHRDAHAQTFSRCSTQPPRRRPPSETHSVNSNTKLFAG